MGLDAFVMCTCFAERRCREPPFPFDELYIDDEYMLSVRGDDPDGARWGALLRWKHDACTHENMEQASEHIGNWSTYRMFQDALHQTPADYPVLLAELPNLNGGLTTASQAAHCLQEIERFRGSANQLEVTVLLDADDGTVVQTGVAAYRGIFLLCGNEPIRFGLDAGRFFIESREESVLFSARRMRQEISDPVALSQNARDVDVRFIDQDTGAVFTCHAGVGIHLDEPGTPTPIRIRYPTLLRAETRLDSSDAHGYVLRALEVVFRASIETGNPVCWT